jgi:hypothetical protein
LLKQHIREISIVKNDTIQIDSGNGRRVFLPFNLISIPVMNDAYTLIVELNNYINSYTKYRFEHFIFLLEQIQSNGGNGGGNPQYIYKKTPKMMDERNPNVIYRGFTANANDSITEPLFCIEKITIVEPGIMKREWAEANTTAFNLLWNERETYNYA